MGPLSVRSASRADAAEMFVAVMESRAELATMSWWRDDLTESGLEQWLAYCESAWDDGRHFEFSVGDPDSGHLGSVGLGPVRWESRRANLSYWVRTSGTRRGIGVRSATLDRRGCSCPAAWTAAPR